LGESPAILVLGIGNLLLRDEGLGVHAARALAESYETSPNVTILDGGTAGTALLDAILRCDHLIVVDVAHLQLPPGTITRLARDSLPRLFKAKQSAHDWGFSEVLLQANLVGHEPRVVVIAVEPLDISSWTIDLSPLLAARLPDVIGHVVTEIEASGGRIWKRGTEASIWASSPTPTST
jgi:hydrogenase maturation protease